VSSDLHGIILIYDFSTHPTRLRAFGATPGLRPKVSRRSRAFRAVFPSKGGEHQSEGIAQKTKQGEKK
jgi:hypothetical protein